MRILVTGASGFVGHHLSAELTSAGHQVIRLSRPQDCPHPGPDDVLADVCDAPRLADVVATLKPEGCIHLAGIAFVPTGWSHPELVFEVNVNGTLNLLEALRQQAPHARLLVISSAQIYGVRAGEPPQDEDAPFAPGSLYAVSKLAADLTTLLYARRYGMAAITARPCNHIGPGQSIEFVVPSFARQVADIAAGRQPALMKVGNLQSEREFMDVRDVARAYRLILEQGQVGRGYNITTGRIVKIGYVLEELCRLAGVQPRIEINPARFRPTDSQPVLSAARLTRDTGWRPERRLEDTLADIYAAVRQTPPGP
jgi:GDP-4-dehydro-6-deoxy-D-mannose reductase